MSARRARKLQFSTAMTTSVSGSGFAPISGSLSGGGEKEGLRSRKLRGRNLRSRKTCLRLQDWSDVLGFLR